MSFQVLGQEVDKKGLTLTIKHNPTIAFTPAYTFFIREVASLIDNKNGFAYTHWEDKDTPIIWAEDSSTGKVVGILCYDKSLSRKMFSHFSIVLTAVDENYRQRGIHQIMNSYYEEQARLNKCLAIRAMVNMNNHVRFKTAEKDKLSPLFYIMSKKIQ